MPSRTDLLTRHVAALETAEQRAARALATVYNQARREIAADLISGWNQSAISGPADAERFLRNSGLLSQIDARMRQLEAEVGVQLRGIVTSSTEAGIAQIQRELALLPASIRDNFTGTFDQINNRMVERYLYPATDGVRLATTSTALTLRRELSVGVVQGESFPSLVRRLMAATPTGEGQAVWANGRNSAELMVRRTVIAAENGAKVEAIGEVEKQIPEVRKQAFAVIGKNTTDCCIRVHGQIKPVNEPFELTGEPRFADRIMHSPFHWRCRTVVALYHPAFEASAPTANMSADAKAEQERRKDAREKKRSGGRVFSADRSTSALTAQQELDDLLYRQSALFDRFGEARAKERAARDADDEAGQEAARAEQARIRAEGNGLAERIAALEAAVERQKQEQAALLSARLEKGTAAEARQRLADLANRSAQTQAEITEAETRHAALSRRISDGIAANEGRALLPLFDEREALTEQIVQLRKRRDDDGRSIVYVDTPSNTGLKTNDPGLQDAAASFNRLVSLAVWKDEVIGVDIKTGRAFAEVEKKRITISLDKETAVVIHEMAHVLESRPEILQKALVFYDRRTTGDKLEKLSDLKPDNIYRDDEVTRKDKWPDPYVGKDYGRSYTEILSMGIEYMYKDPARFARVDPDYFDFIFNLVRGR